MTLSLIHIYGVSVQFKVLWMGTDCLVLAAGGDTGHIGAIAFGDRGGCLSNAREGHREGVVTELIYRELESVVFGGLAVLAGIHVEGITKEQITEMCIRDRAYAIWQYHLMYLIGMQH